MSNQEREAFEAYCQSIGHTLKTGDSGRYLGGYGAELWAGFKAGAAYQRAQQPQSAEAVSAQVRFRRPEKGRPGWSVWQQTSIKPNMPAWSIDSVGYEVEYRLLYTTPQPIHG